MGISDTVSAILVDIASEGWPAYINADAIYLRYLSLRSRAVPIEAIQRIGRKETKTGPWRLNRQFAATYSRGVFTVTEREDYKPRPPDPPPPDWFEVRAMEVKDGPRTSLFDIGRRRELVYRFVEACQSGAVALAPWQRKAVWTERQRIDLLDSLIRGISIGALTIWEQPYGQDWTGRPFEGCESSPRAKLIVDGQQRATTLVMAAQGKLDHWRWNGDEWTTGRGFLTPRMAVTCTMSEMGLGLHSWLTQSEADPATVRRVYRDAEAIERTDLDLMVLAGSTAQMIETYRRLATHGSPHSPEDLAIMEAWAAEHVTE